MQGEWSIKYAGWLGPRLACLRLAGVTRSDSVSHILYSVRRLAPKVLQTYTSQEQESTIITSHLNVALDTALQNFSALHLNLEG